MVKNINPFLIYGYNGPEYFCDRKVETQKLISAINNGRNITLMSERRMGKTGLIYNAFHQISKIQPEMRCFYIDIFATHSLAEFTKLLAQEVLGKLDSSSEGFFNKISKFFKSCRPVLSMDPNTGSPNIMLDFVPSNAENTLKEIFTYIKNSGKECVIAIDEFQQITYYTEKGTEALLRSYIQFLPNAHFIFSGSKRKLMNDMFSLPSRPFFQSTQKLNIGVIDKHTYWEFADEHLRSKGIDLPEVIFGGFYDTLYGHTWYIQRMLNKIYEDCSGTVTDSDVEQVMLTIIGEEEYNYQRQYSLLTANQQMLLKAVAFEFTVKEINSKDFIQKHSLGAASSVNRAMDYLLNNEFTVQSPNGYQIYDRFFGIWLRRAFR